MLQRLWPRLRHPLYPKLRITRASNASGRHAVLAGTMQELASAARTKAGALRAVFVLTGEGMPLPSSDEREQLWQWFEVPSFVLVLDRDGRLLAYECEAKDGLHIAGEERRAGPPETFPCPCGRPGRRVSSLSAVHGFPDTSRGARSLRAAARLIMTLVGGE
jgi:hypothetical protein